MRAGIFYREPITKAEKFMMRAGIFYREPITKAEKFMKPIVVKSSSFYIFNKTN